MSGNNPSLMFSRRRLIAMAGTAAASAVLASCTSVRARREQAYVENTAPLPQPLQPLGPTGTFGDPRLMYAAVQDGGHLVPAVPFDKVDPRYYRQIVADPTGEMPGTVVIDTSSHFLYLTRGNGEAIRYGVGLGREGFEWSGRGVIEWKQAWPRWFPPEEMIARQPELEKYRAIQVPGKNEWVGGMEGGIQNPLGARAHYIYQDGKDTLYRVHGSPEWWTIGKSVSSGCVRMINQDVIDLYDRVPEGTPLVVTSGLPVIG